MVNNFMNLEQIQTSKISKDTICYLNSYITDTSRRKSSIGQCYETLEFYTKEKFSKSYPWKYKINQYGYRGDDWNFEKTSAFFGCSFTFGIGVETPAADIVQHKIKKIIPNLGIPGGSCINIIKSFIAFAKIHPINIAIISLPPFSRFYRPTLHNTGWRSDNLIPGFHVEKQDKQIFKFWTNTTDVSYTLDYIDWATDFANSRDIKIYWSSWDRNSFEILRKSKLKNLFSWPDIITDARDGMHPGQTTHNELANICLKFIK